MLKNTPHGLKRLRKNPELKAKKSENIPQGLKAGVDLIALAARVKSCSFKTRLSPRAVMARSMLLHLPDEYESAPVKLIEGACAVLAASDDRVSGIFY